MIRAGLMLALLAGMAAAQEQPVSVSGTVVGTSGAPLSKANVTLQPITGPRQPGAQVQPFGATTDSSGRFSIAGVPPGGYSLFAEHVGYLTASYGANGRQNGGTLLDITPGRQLTDLTIQLMEQAVITGAIMDQDGDPLPRVDIRLMAMTYNATGHQVMVPRGMGTVNELGEFRVSGIPPGQYYLEAQPRPTGAGPRAEREQRPIPTFYPGMTDASSAVLIRVGPGATLTGMNIRMSVAPVFHARGKVNGAPPNQGISIRVTHDDAGPQQTPMMAVMSRDGMFDVQGLTNGTWTLSVYGNQGPGQYLGSQQVSVNGQDLNDLVIDAMEPAPIRGTVKFENASGEPAPTPLSLSLEGLNVPTQGGPPQRTGDDGSFTLPGVAPGKYRLRVQGLAAGQYLKAVRSDGRDVLASGIDIGPSGGGGNLEVTIGAPSAEIFGILLGPDGNNAPGSVVTIEPEETGPGLTDLFRRMDTDQDGRFSFKGLSPGTYRVFGWDRLDPGQQFDPELLKAHEDKSVTVTVAEGDRTLVTLTESVQ